MTTTSIDAIKSGAGPSLKFEFGYNCTCTAELSGAVVGLTAAPNTRSVGRDRKSWLGESVSISSATQLPRKLTSLTIHRGHWQPDGTRAGQHQSDHAGGRREDGGHRRVHRTDDGPGRLCRSQCCACDVFRRRQRTSACSVPGGNLALRKGALTEIKCSAALTSAEEL